MDVIKFYCEKGTGPLTTNPEKRKNARLRHVSKLSLKGMDADNYAWSRMGNYSRDGAYFESDLKLKVGQIVFIGIENSPYADRPGTHEGLHGVIKWRKEVAASIFKYGYGLQYCQPSTDEQPHLKTPSDRPSCSRLAEATARPDLRQHPRFTVDKPVDFSTRNQLLRGRIRNISPKGAFIESDKSFATGQIVVVALPVAATKKGRLVKAEVVRITEKGIGIRFLKISPKPE